MKLYANSKPFSQVINPFQLDQTFSVHGDNWNLRCDWLHEKSGFEFKVRILDLAIEREMQNGFHPHHLRNPSPNYDFMDFLCTFLVGKTKKAKKRKNTVHKNSVFFFLLVMCALARQLFSQKQFKFFSRIPEKKKEERKTKYRLIFVEIRFQISVVRFEFQNSKSRFPNRIRRPSIFRS